MEKEALRKLFENETIYLVGEPELPISIIKEKGEAVHSDNNPESNNPPSMSKRTGLAVVCYYAEDMPAEEKNLLEKILAAVNIELKQSLIHNVKVPNDEIRIEASKYLCFGSKAHQIMEPDAEYYHVIEKDQYTIMLADELKVIKENVDLKKKLWSGLQKMFLH